jgi:hypothetical protein
MGPGLRRDGEQGKSRIVTMFAEANWITASFAGVTEVLVPALVRRRPNKSYDLVGTLVETATLWSFWVIPVNWEVQVANRGARHPNE